MPLMSAYHRNRSVGSSGLSANGDGALDSTGKATANGAAVPPPTDADIAGWLGLFAEPGQVLELRAPKAGFAHRTKNFSRFFGAGQLLEMAQEALRISGHAPGVYFTLNPINPALKGGKHAAKDTDILRRRRLLIDCDPVRDPSAMKAARQQAKEEGDDFGGISSTDEEKARALAVAKAIRDHLRAESWPEPILADSGNGWHLVYMIDLPADDQELVKRCLHALAGRFGTGDVDVDTTVFNPSRIVKCYGTKASKGQDTAARPHRYSRVVEIPEALQPVPPELLEALADSALMTGMGSAPPDAGEPETVMPGESPGRSLPTYGGNGRWTPEARAVVYLERCDPAVAGQKGHNQTFKTACKVGPGFDLPQEVALRLLRSYNERCQPPWSDKELEHKVRDAYAKEARRGWLLEAERPSNGRAASSSNGHGGNGRPAGGSPTAQAETLDGRMAKRPRTDLGNAERLAARHGEDLRYCHPWAKWLVWDGRRWSIDNRAAARRRAKATVRAILAESATIEDDDRRKEHVRWAIASENRARIEAMLALGSSEPDVPILTDEMDRDAWALNCRNGTLDLRTGRLRPHRREDLITKQCPVEYHPVAQCPLWEATLRRIFAENDGIIRFWQRLCGLILTGSVTEQILPILHGAGANGKSTILNVLLDILGPDYSMKAPPDLLMVKRGEAHPTERADLFGRRLVVAIETGEGSRINEVMVKELTGSDKIRARRMREDFWEFSPTHKILLCTNHRPTVRGTDHAVWRRIRLIPFIVTIPDDQQDKALSEKLAAELPGILAWCVRGCLDWQREGLTPPREVAEATDRYRQDEDVLGAFLAENCLVNREARTKASLLYERYRAWAEKAGETTKTQRRFGDAMTERGFARTTSNGTWYLGVGLRAEDADRERSAY